MSQVTVLMPNARRQTVKITPNSTILEIIETCCSKAGLPADEFDLRHHRSILDSTTTVRFSGIPQNAQLELVEAKVKRKESTVTLCVQVENGERFQGECQPTNTLLEAIKKIAPLHSEKLANPVVIYMRREVIGLEALNKTTLREIGLTGGRAVVRLLDKSIEELRMQANVSAPLVRPSLDREEKESNDKKCPPDEPSVENVNETREMVLLHAVVSSEDDVRIEGRPEFEPVVHSPLNVTTNQEMMLVEKGDSIVELSSPTEPDEKRARTKSPGIIEDVEVEKVILLGDRSAVAYNLDTAPTSLIEDLPDDFYELTIADVKSLVAAARKAVKELEEAPLMTSAQRKLDEDGIILQKLGSHKTCIIRIRFPDRTVLQGLFKPLETVRDVHNFVRSYLEQPALQFDLFTTPPKKILDLDTRLIEADCVPGANIYFGPLVPQNQSFLKWEVLQKFSTYSAALHVAHQTGSSEVIVKNEPNSIHSDKQVENPKPGPSRSNTSDSRYVSNKQNHSDVPKWFKFGK